MPEEPETFTFVDKRRTQAESERPETPEASPADAAVSTENADAEPLDTEAYGDEAPDTYSLIGYCISLLASDAWQKLGLMADPKSGQAQPDLAQAKAAIDAVGDLAARLEAAPTEVVPDNLRRELRTMVNDLRLNYVAQQNQNR